MLIFFFILLVLVIVALAGLPTPGAGPLIGMKWPFSLFRVRLLPACLPDRPVLLSRRKTGPID